VKKNKIVTIAVVSLIALFAVLIALNLFNPKNGKKPTQTQGGQPANEMARSGGGDRQSSQGENAQRGERPASANGEQGQGQNARGGERPSGGSNNANNSGNSGRGGNAGGAGGGSSRNATAIRVTPVSTSTIEKSVIINGEILARNQVTIYPTVGGKLVETKLGIGDRVARGQVVAMVDPSRPGEVYSQSPIVSTVSGTILQAPFNIGDTLTTQSAVFVVGDLSSLLVETFVPERFVASVRQGMRAQLWFEAIPGERFEAEVIEINPVLETASRTLRIRLRFVNPDSRIKAGMFATVSLVTSRKVNVPVVQRTSVISTYGSWIVFTVDENNIARKREVTLGIENEDFFEILSGLKIGENVVSAGQNFLSDGDPVRIVD